MTTTAHHSSSHLSSGIGTTQHRNHTTSNSSPYTPYTYQITQPTDNPDATAQESGGYDILNETHFDAIPATVSFYNPETLCDNDREFRDDHSHERLQTITDFETSKKTLSNTGHVVTTEIQLGDTFYFTAYSKLYEYLGVTNVNGDYPEKLVFAPVNESPNSTKLNSVSIDKDREYMTKFKTDFAHKFAPYKNRGDRTLHILRINTEQYDTDLSTVTSLHDIPPQPTTTVTPDVSTITPNITSKLGVIASGKTIISSIWESIQEFRAADPPNANTNTPGVIKHTPHTKHRGELPAETHSVVYQTRN